MKYNENRYDSKWRSQHDRACAWFSSSTTPMRPDKNSRSCKVWNVHILYRPWKGFAWEMNKKQKEDPRTVWRRSWPILENSMLEFLLSELFTWVSQRGNWFAVLFPPYEVISFSVSIFLECTGHLKRNFSWDFVLIHRPVAQSNLL